LAHVHNVGLTIEHHTAGDNLPIVLQLKSEEDVIVANEVIASIEFAAGDSDGTDGATVAAGIHAIAEGTFSASANATKLVFTTGVSETAASSATAKATLSSIGDFQVAGDLVVKDGGTIGSASDLDAIAIASDGVVTFSQIPVMPSNSFADTIQYLVVAGGGGGGGGYSTSNIGNGGGGGAGGLVTGTVQNAQSIIYAIIIGGGGAGSVAGSSNSANGVNSSFGSFISIGGGAGASYGAANAQAGGSGGGTAYSHSGTAAGTVGQGNAGGIRNQSGPGYGAGGGGGAGAVGSDGTATVGGNGGVGSVNTIISTTIAEAQSVGEVSSGNLYFAGGGGGGLDGASTGAAGSGGLGGGADGTDSATTPTAATQYTGGGGGGGGNPNGSNTASSGSNGGDGIVILRMTTLNYSGTTTGSPTVVTDGDDTILIYKSSGSYTS
jgi:hypothetical protein